MIKKGEIVMIKSRGRHHRLGVEYYNNMQGRVVGIKGDFVIVDIIKREEWMKKLQSIRYKKTNVLLPYWAVEFRDMETMEVE